MRGQMETHVKELERVYTSLTATEQKHLKCQESLQQFQGICAAQAYTVRELQGQVFSIFLILASCAKKLFGMISPVEGTRVSV